MIAIEGAFDLAFLEGCRESWVLATTARDGGTLHGYTFSTLERIGGTPCVLLGVMSVRRNAKRDTVLKGLMKEAFHRALMAFPDEDVVVGGRFALPDALQALKEVDDVIPAPGSRAVGEERAWGRRLAKRFGVDGSYVAEQFMSTKTPRAVSLILNPQSLRRLPPAQRVSLKGSMPHQAEFSSPMAGRWLRILQSSEPDSPQSVDALSALIRSRAMCRSFLPDPVAPSIIREIVDLGTRAPSAGRSQGYTSFSSRVMNENRCGRDLSQMTVEIDLRFRVSSKRRCCCCCSSTPTYVERYAESDKAHTGLGNGRGEWRTPFWFVDAGMAAMSMLLAAQAYELGALFFAMPQPEVTFGQRSVSPSRRQPLACSLSDIETMTTFSLAGQDEVQLVLVEVQTMSFTEGSGSRNHGEFGHGTDVTVRK